MSVLLVEDSRMLAEQLREALMSVAGVQVIATVDNEAEATALILGSAVDVVVLDLQLRQGTGFGVLRGIGTRRPAIIVMTNFTLPGYRRFAERLGVDYFLDKSTDCGRLTDLIGNLRDARVARPH